VHAPEIRGEERGVQLGVCCVGTTQSRGSMEQISAVKTVVISGCVRKKHQESVRSPAGEVPLVRKGEARPVGAGRERSAGRRGKTWV